MQDTFKPLVRKRIILGWRQAERRRSEIRSKHRAPPLPAKQAA
jgi:hypothetical protein